MTDKTCTGEAGEEGAEQFVEDDDLFGGAVVLVLVLGAVAVPSFVADSDAVGVVTFDVASSHAQGTTIIEATISPYIKVVTGQVAKAACFVARCELLDREVLAGAGVGAVEDEKTKTKPPPAPLKGGDYIRYA